MHCTCWAVSCSPSPACSEHACRGPAEQRHILPAAQSVSFTVSVLPAEETGLKLHKGVVNGLVWQQQKGNGAPLVTSVTPGATLANVALFIDSNKASLHPAATTEDWCACLCLPHAHMGGACMPAPWQR